MTKRVALIIERANIVLGNAERSIFELASALSALGYEVDILAAKGQTDAKNIKLLCEHHSGQRVSLKVFKKELQKYLAVNEYDFIHSVLPLDFADVYQPRGGSYAEAIRRNAASYQSRWLSFFKRIISYTNLRRSAFFLAEKKLCKNPNGPVISTLSNYVWRQFRDHYHVDPARLDVSLNGVRISGRFKQQQADVLRSQIMARLNLVEADEPVFFLFVANNFRLKGLRPLMEAFSRLNKRNPQNRAFLVVAGHGKSGRYRWLARTLGIHQRVVFLGSLRHIQNAFSITDVAVLPTFYDPSSRFILEALGAARPVITTKFNGAIDLFEDGRHGIVVDRPENTEALSGALEFFTDDENIETYSKNILDDDLCQRVSIMRAAEQISKLYERIEMERK